jgi:hypothetical protein
MTVYVDDMRMQATVPNGGRSVSGRWSHLMADDEQELIDFAVGKLGMRPQWIQHPGSPDVHFDVVDSLRIKALELGAVSLPCRSDEWSAFFESQHDKFVRRCENCGQPLRFIDTTVGSEHWFESPGCDNPEAGWEDNKRAWMPRPTAQASMDAPKGADA